VFREMLAWDLKDNFLNDKNYFYVII
jgi:hypothetical protein